MKKYLVFFVLSLAVLGLCFAQSSNVTQRIVGTWTDIEDRLWTFGADGKLIYGSHVIGDVEFNYNVTDSKLILEIKGDEVYRYWSGVTQKYSISISSDGRTITLTGGENVPGWSVAGPGWSENILIRN
jgi:hypothetical protein